MCTDDPRDWPDEGVDLGGETFYRVNLALGLSGGVTCQISIHRCRNGRFTGLPEHFHDPWPTLVRGCHIGQVAFAICSAAFRFALRVASHFSCPKFDSTVSPPSLPQRDNAPHLTPRTYGGGVPTPPRSP